jgi:hypothetical protein
MEMGLGLKMCGNLDSRKKKRAKRGSPGWGKNRDRLKVMSSTRSVLCKPSSDEEGN